MKSEDVDERNLTSERKTTCLVEVNIFMMQDQFLSTLNDAASILALATGDHQNGDYSRSDGHGDMSITPLMPQHLLVIHRVLVLGTWESNERGRYVDHRVRRHPPKPCLCALV